MLSSRQTARTPHGTPVSPPRSFSAASRRDVTDPTAGNVTLYHLVLMGERQGASCVYTAAVWSRGCRSVINFASGLSETYWCVPDYTGAKLGAYASRRASQRKGAVVIWKTGVCLSTLSHVDHTAHGTSPLRLLPPSARTFIDETDCYKSQGTRSGPSARGEAEPSTLFVPLRADVGTRVGDSQPQNHPSERRVGTHHHQQCERACVRGHQARPPGGQAPGPWHGAGAGV